MPGRREGKVRIFHGKKLAGKEAEEAQKRLAEKTRRYQGAWRVCVCVDVVCWRRYWCMCRWQCRCMCLCLCLRLRLCRLLSLSLCLCVCMSVFACLLYVRQQHGFSNPTPSDFICRTRRSAAQWQCSVCSEEAATETRQGGAQSHQGACSSTPSRAHTHTRTRSLIHS
jgi:hypothetical protein